MTQVTTKELVALRGIGLKSVVFDGEGFIREVEFFPGATPVDDSPSLPKHLDLGAPEMCACGHDITQHSGDLCLLGCDSSTCNPKSDAQKATDAP